jgi:hydrogenase/urease accessory protein HupE
VNKARLFTLTILFATILGGQVHGHAVPYSYLDLQVAQRNGGGRVEAKLVVHSIDLALFLDVDESLLFEPEGLETRRQPILRLISNHLVISLDRQPTAPQQLRMEPLADRREVILYFEYEARSPIGLIQVAGPLFTADPEHQTFVNLFADDLLMRQDVLTVTQPRLEYFTTTRQGIREVLRKFIPAGIHHIFIGPDHILFLIGLLLLGGSLRRLLLIVSAFTIAHSITLTLAALDLLNIPASITEPIIALSIVYVGVDNLMVRENGRDLRGWLAFFFGFIHGFGFAGVLREFGLPSAALGWSVFSFNLGVEIGQAVIVILTTLIIRTVCRHRPTLQRPILVGGSIIIILAGAWWFVTRTFNL